MSNKPIFGRTASILVGENEGGAILIDGFRASFSIRKTDTEDPNTCVYSVYNLGFGTRSVIEKLDLRLITLRLFLWGILQTQLLNTKDQR
jgi:hypothetical protein